MIRRPMMYIASSFAAAIICSYYLSFLAMAPIVLSAVFFFISEKDFWQEKIALIVIISYLIGSLCFTFYVIEKNKTLLEENSTAEIICKITRIETKSRVSVDGSEKEYLQLIGNINQLNGNEMKNKEKILVNYYYDNSEDEKGLGHYELTPGDIAFVSGKVQKPEGRKNPGCFDYALYLQSINIQHIIVADEIKSLYPREKVSLQGRLYLIKENFIKQLERVAGSDTAGLMRAIMFGEKSDLDEEMYEEFQINGTAHVLAVSGLHVGIIYGFIAALWRGRKGKVYFGVIMLFFLAYMTMASFAPSVVRAVIMVWLHIFAKMNGQRYDMSSAAFFVALLMMVHNPMSIFNSGFQMSFLAVLTLSLMLPLIKRVYQGALLGSIAVQVGLLPYMVYSFNYVSIAAVFVNVIVIFLTGIIVPAGLCSMIIMTVSDELFQLISGVIFGLCKMMTAVNGMTGIEGITVFMVKSPPVSIVAAYYLILLIFVSEDGRLRFIRKDKKNIMVLSILIVMSSLLFGVVAGNDFKRSDVVFVDVGQGDCIHLRTDNDGNYLVDGGGSITYNIGKKTLKPYLLKNGARVIDGAFVTHLHTDHFKGIAELCREGMVSRIFIYDGYKVREKEVLEETGLSKEKITYLSKGQIVKLDSNTYIEVLWPERRSEVEYQTMDDETDENDMSLIFKINKNDHKIIATGDVDTACLDTLAKVYGEALDAEILKVAHHGSKYSESDSFAQKVSPDYAVFQVGKNNFGHPNKGIVEKFRREGIIIYRNDKHGAVAFDFGRNGKTKVRTVKGEID